MREPPSTTIHDMMAYRVERERAEELRRARLAADHDAWRTFYHRPKAPPVKPWWEYDAPEAA